MQKTPFFYGWVIVAIGTLGIWMTSPGQTYVFSLFIDHFILDLEISRTVVSSLYTAGTLIVSFAMPIAGRLFDLYGPRKTVIASATLLGLVCIAMSRVDGLFGLFIGILLLRGLGQQALLMYSKNAIAQWFIRNRGKALGVSGFGGAAAMGLLPIIVYALIAGFGWRTSYVLIGLTILALYLPLVILLLRDRPEQYGLLPDGENANGGADSDETPLEEANWRLREAIRTPAFWILAAGIGMIASLGTGLMFHQISIFAAAGVDSQAAAATYLPIAISAAFATLVVGFVLDRIPVHYVLSVAMVGLAVAIGIIQMMSTPALALLYAIVLGTSQGMISTLGSIAVPAFFGRRHLGEISGFMGMIGAAASAFGPLPLAIGFDVFGRYSQVLSILLFFPLAMAVIGIFLRKPQAPPLGV